MTKRILLLDTNFSARPIHDYLISTGNEVFVVGGNPRDALARVSSKYVELDYSDIMKLRSLIKDLNIDYLVPGGNDFSYKICSEISSDIGFYNIDTIESNDIINNKERFREFAIREGLNVPKVIEPSFVSEAGAVIVKPVDAYSGHGITVIDKPNKSLIDDAVKVAESFSKSRRCVIEEFVRGQLYSHSAFVVDGEIIIDFIVEEHCIVNQFVVDTSRVLYDFDIGVLSKIRDNVFRIVKSLNLVDGLVHTQFIYNGSDFWIIEVTRRCPGDLYSKLIEYSTGFPYAEYYARPFINRICKDFKKNLERNKVMRHTITLQDKINLNNISFLSPFSAFKYIPLSLTGDEIRESPFSRIGILFTFSKSEEELLGLMESAVRRKLYIVE